MWFAHAVSNSDHPHTIGRGASNKTIYVSPAPVNQQYLKRKKKGSKEGNIIISDGHTLNSTTFGVSSLLEPVLFLFGQKKEGGGGC